MLIRDMKLEDIEQLAILYKQFWDESSNIEKMKLQFQKLQSQDTHIFLCAEENNKVVGSVMGIVCEELYGECEPFLVVENMIVDKNSRNKGIGKALFSELEYLAKKRNCTQIILVTESDRHDACGFYESIGFSAMVNKGYKKKI